MEDGNRDGQDGHKEGVGPVDGQLAETGEIGSDGKREGTRSQGQPRQQVQNEAADKAPDNSFPCPSEEAPRDHSEQHQVKASAPEGEAEQHRGLDHGDTEQKWDDGIRLDGQSPLGRLWVGFQSDGLEAREHHDHFEASEAHGRPHFGLLEHLNVSLGYRCHLSDDQACGEVST